MTNEEKQSRLFEVASTILAGTQHDELNVVVLNKALFYFDLAHFRDTGETLTRTNYVAFKHGPVVEKYDRQFKAMEEAGIVRQDERWDGAKPIVLKRPVEPKHMNGESTKLANSICKHFGTMTSGQAERYSHKNPGWRIAWNASKASYKPMAISMRIAIQQIVATDPWMHIPLNENEYAATQRADTERGEAW